MVLISTEVFTFEWKPSPVPAAIYAWYRTGEGVPPLVANLQEQPGKPLLGGVIFLQQRRKGAWVEDVDIFVEIEVDIDVEKDVQVDVEVDVEVDVDVDVDIDGWETD